MAGARYEVRVNGRLSERARGAFCAMNVGRSVPPQTIVFGELTEQSDLGDLLALCSAMGLEVVSFGSYLPTSRRGQTAPALDEAK